LLLLGRLPEVPGGGRVPIRSGSDRQSASSGSEQPQSQKVCPGLGLGKLRHSPPWITGMDPALAGKVSSVGRLGSFYQISVVFPFVKAFSFSNYLDSRAREAGIVMLGRVVQA
jgi:hypothetical protein